MWLIVLVRSVYWIVLGHILTVWLQHFPHKNRVCFPFKLINCDQAIFPLFQSLEKPFALIVQVLHWGFTWHRASSGIAGMNRNVSYEHVIWRLSQERLSVNLMTACRVFTSNLFYTSSCSLYHEMHSNGKTNTRARLIKVAMQWQNTKHTIIYNQHMNAIWINLALYYCAHSFKPTSHFCPQWLTYNIKVEHSMGLQRNITHSAFVVILPALQPGKYLLSATASGCWLFCSWYSEEKTLYYFL